MTKLRGYIPTMFMAATLMFGATVANAGILVSDRTSSATTTEEDPCKEPVKEGLAALASDLLTFAKTGILVSDRNGILVSDRTKSQETCGILVSD